MADPVDDDETRRTLVEAWTRSVAEAGDDQGWSVLEITAWANSLPPDVQWAAVLDMIGCAPNDDALGRVAAGPLEGLLRKRGAEFIDRVEAQAAADPRFARALTNVWPHGIADAVSERVRALQAAVENPLTLAPLDADQADAIALDMDAMDALILEERERDAAELAAEPTPPPTPRPHD